MQLFKRLLLSFFPANIGDQQINPASIFISFITSKEYFSVINRKVVENYKLNLFDIALDPFEFKIGFGNSPHTDIKDLDTYYSYCASANINGHRLFNIANTANAIAIMSSTIIVDSFRPHAPIYFINFIFCIYLFSYICVSRFKIFPHQTTNQNFNRFIESFFSFYEVVFLQTGKQRDPEEFQKIKKNLLQHHERRQVLMQYYQSYNNIFTNSLGDHTDFINRLYQDQIKDENVKGLINEYIQTARYSTQQTTFSILEKKLLPYILPADILLRHIFIDTDPIQIVDSILKNIYHKDTISKLVHKISKGQASIYDLLLYITDYKLFKNNFFPGIKKYINKVINQHNSQEEQEEIDDFMSSIGSMENIHSNQIPEKIRKESKLMEKLINFYITYIGGLRIGRGDNFYARLEKKDIITTILKKYKLNNNKPYGLHQYGSMLYSYSKNAFYYKYAANNIRAGKEKFFLPFRSTLKKADSNIYLVQLLNETAIATLLQDMNQKDIKLYINNQSIVDTFKKLFAKKIGNYLNNNDKKLIQLSYGPIQKCLTDIQIIDNIQKNITKQDIFQLKDNLYTMDFRVFQGAIQKLALQNMQRQQHYADMNILLTIALLRETIFGMLLYMHYIHQSQTDDKHNEILYQIYTTDVLHLHEDYTQHIMTISKELIIQYQDLLNKRIALDDNKNFMAIAYTNRETFIKNKDRENIMNEIIGEDVMRFRGFIKNINYYNKRFVIPK